MNDQEIPNDTILDLSEETRDIPEKARRLMKAFYLASPTLKSIRAEMNWSSTDLINAAEAARRQGWIKINVTQDGDDYKFGIVLTPSGATEGWLRKAMTGWHQRPDPRDPDHTREPPFVYHNCWRCKDGALPCVNRNAFGCENLHARDD